MEDFNNNNAACQRHGVIYKITNLIDGKAYIGQTVQKLSARLSRHKKDKNTCIGQAIQKYGWENFTSEIIETCPQNMLNEREKFWIKFYDCMSPNGYNLTSGGDNRRIVSEETRKKNFPRRIWGNPDIGRVKNFLMNIEQIYLRLIKVRKSLRK